MIYMYPRSTLPSRIENAAHLDDVLSEPSPAAIESLAQCAGDLVILGVAGKMGPTLARMARRASDLAGIKRHIFGVARFADGDAQTRLRAWGVEPIRCDLFDPVQCGQLPDAAIVIYLVGMKFGSTGREALTWATNCWLPGVICRRYAHARIVALSTGNVYPLTPVTQDGSRETDAPGPVGEYAMSLAAAFCPSPFGEHLPASSASLPSRLLHSIAIKRSMSCVPWQRQDATTLHSIPVTMTISSSTS
jgi:hypothetical protein